MSINPVMAVDDVEDVYVRPEPFALVPQWVIQRTVKDHGALALYAFLALAVIDGQTRRGFRGQAWIAEQMGVDTRTVKRWTAILRERGVIYTVRTRRHDGRQGKNIYLLPRDNPDMLRDIRSMLDEDEEFAPDVDVDPGNHQGTQMSPGSDLRKRGKTPGKTGTKPSTLNHGSRVTQMSPQVSRPRTTTTTPPLPPSSEGAPPKASASPQPVVGVIDKPAQSPTTTHGTRVPEDFAPTEAMKSWARVNAPLCGTRDHEQFMDYWLSVPGQRGRKVSWERTWRNWMREQQSRYARTARGSTPRPYGPVVPPPPTTVQGEVMCHRHDQPLVGCTGCAEELASDDRARGLR